jgi:uncharacterized protein (TIGR02145 family)
MKATQMLMMNKPFVIPEITGYGKLYSVGSIFDANGFAPTGWHVPSKDEWSILSASLGGGGKMKMTGLDFWLTPNTGAENAYNLGAVGSGKRNTSGTYSKLKERGYWHSTTYNPSYHWGYFLRYDTDTFCYFNIVGGYHVAVRLIKDNSTNDGTLKDYDGNIYDTVKVGTQVWTVQNWKCTHYKNGVALGATDWYYYDDDPDNN